MALPEDFNKIYGSAATGGLTPISDVNYAKGWEFVGSNPPTKNDFSYLQNLSDLKSQWLYSNKLQRTDPFGDIKADGAAAISKAINNLGLGEIYAPLSDFTYYKTSSSVVGNQPGGLRFMCGETSVPTDENGNVFITLPDTFLNRVVYAEAHQAKDSYAADVDPYIFSSYPAPNGPISAISFAVRNSRTGASLRNSAINIQYFVKGY